MQNNELTTQLAQINTVSGIEKLNTTLGSISGQISGNQSIQASSLIGHGVMVPGKEILVGNDAGKVSTTPFGVELERTADSVTATISDATGKVVRTIELGGLTAGVHSFSWDGSLEDGTNAPDGSYTVAINAKTAVSSWWRSHCVSPWLTASRAVRTGQNWIWAWRGPQRWMTCA